MAIDLLKRSQLKLAAIAFRDSGASHDEALTVIDEAYDSFGIDKAISGSLRAHEGIAEERAALKIRYSLKGE